MRVSVTMNNARLRELSRAQARAASMTALQMLSETRNEAVMPFDTGHLQNESTFVDDSKVRNGLVTITTDTPYARKLYFHPEFNFQRGKNANAGGAWWDEWLKGGKKNRPKQLFKEFFRRETGGVVR